MQKSTVHVFTLAGILVAASSLTACAEQAQLRVEQGIGPKPTLPAEVHNPIPTINIAPAKGWPEGGKPTPAAGLAVNALASGLDHPRWLYVLPNGDVLVAETNAPERPEDGKGVRGFAQKLVMKRAGATVPSPNRITLLRDADGDGVAETKTVFLKGLNSPFGMALVGNDLYIADTDALLRFQYKTGATSIDAKGEKVLTLPDGPINHHWTKNVVASKDGKKLYVSIGSNSNVAENGIDAEEGRAAIVEFEIATGKARSFATGLRNPVGMALQPQSGALWVSVNERDELGSDLVPDYMTAVKDGGFYGWPYSYYGNHVDKRVQPPRPDLERLHRWRDRGPAWLLEPQATQRLQGDFRTVR
jgi:glucose/arabinose dehydrogenase